MTKPMEKRVEDALAVFAPSERSNPKMQKLVREMLEAADREPPKWPTDESFRAAQLEANRAFGDGEHDGDGWPRSAIRAAFLTDRIVQAAIRFAHSGSDADMQDIQAEVLAAGL